ncbi:MAG: SusC/RagA family TonB-linked outer membrane protein [Bacteroidia bacterium]|nr:SusC/RagA family TonB-linked outer membrane protein [Bacteroidia bacterium]
MKRFLLFIAISILSVTAWAQSQVSGKVTAADSGEPLEGATIMVKGMEAGALTDADGAYTVNVPAGGTVLVFTYTNRKTVEEEISGRNQINVAMAEDLMQTDVQVVTAIGISRQSKELGYSVQNVQGSALTNSREVNPIAGLAGKVAGLQVVNSSGDPGASAFMRLRGGSSVTGDNQPLMVVDGIPINNDQNASGNPDNGSNNYLASVSNSNRAIDLNPGDIESITVLKGGAATALYGIAAANGALIITTKKGTKGIGGGLNVEFNSAYTVNTVNRLPALQNQYSQGVNGGYLDPGPGGARSRSWGAAIDTLFWDGDAAYKWDKNGAIIGASAAAGNANAKKVTPYNQGDFFQSGQTFVNGLAFNGGGERSTYRVSASNTYQTGIVPNSKFQRTTISMSGATDISSKLKASSSISYSNSGGTRMQVGSNTSGIMLGLLRTPPTFDNSNGTTDPTDPTAYMFSDGKQRTYRGGGGYDNPYWTINKNQMFDQVNRVYGNVQLDYKATDWLSFLYRTGADVYSDNRNQGFAIGSNTLPAGQVFNQTILHRHLNHDIMANFQKKLNDNLDLGVLLGVNQYGSQDYNNFTQGDGLNLQDFYHISNAQTVLSRQSVNNYLKRGFYAQEKVGYKNFLYLDLTQRRDWTSAIGGKGFSSFSYNLGFIFTEAFGLADNKVLPYGKLRLSWADVGNDGPIYATSNYYTLGSFADGWTNGIAFPFNGIPAFTHSGVLGNPDLRPENTKTFEIGTDLKFAQNRLGLDFTYWTSKSTDQIFSVPIAASTGYRSIIKNAGEIDRHGFEIVGYATPVKTKDFNWDITVNWSAFRSLVVALDSTTQNISRDGFEDPGIRVMEGEQLFIIYGSRWLRDAQGRALIDPATGHPILDNETGIIGNPNPDWLMGIRNTFNYKALSFSFLFDIRKGGDIWNGTRGALSFFGTSAESGENRDGTKVFNDGLYANSVLGGYDANTGEVVYMDAAGATLGKATGDEANPGVAVNNAIEAPYGQAWFMDGPGSGFTGPAETFIEDGSFVRLREVNLGYTLDRKIFGAKSPVKGATIVLTARNLWLATKYQGVDPETSLVGSRDYQGMDYFNNPNTRSVGAALNLSF